MICNKPIMKIVVNVLFVLATIVIAQESPPPPGIIPPAELDQAKSVVKTFCVHWKDLKFDSMYVKMSSSTLADMSKAKFTNTYGVMSDNSGRLGSFVVKTAIPGEEKIIVKVEMTFIKENPPTAVNGVNNFHMKKDGGKWRVDTIVPPIAPPQENGSGGHPGE